MMDRHDQNEHVSAESTCVSLLDELQGSLERQLELARRGCLDELDELSRQGGVLVSRVAEADLMHSPVFEARKPFLDRLYRELGLTLAAQQQETADALQAIRRGRKTIKAYRMPNSSR